MCLFQKKPAKGFLWLQKNSATIKKTASTPEHSLSEVIVIMCPFLSNHYYTILIHSITERAHDYGYLTFVAPTLRNPSTEQYYLDMLRRDVEVAGIVYLYPTSFLSEVNQMSKLLPIVNIGDKNDEIIFDSIHVSSTKPAYLVAEHLISLGHKKLLIFLLRSAVWNVPVPNDMKDCAGPLRITVWEKTASRCDLFLPGI